MALVVRFKDSHRGDGNFQIGHRGGVVPFAGGEATVSDAIYQEWLDEGYPIEKVREVDPAQQPVSNTFAYHGPSQVAAMEKEMLSKQNVGDFHALGADLSPEITGYGSYRINHGDTPVNVVNTNSALDRPVNPDNRLSPNRTPLVEMTDEEKEQVKAIRATARELRARIGVPTDETNALYHDFRLTVDDEDALSPDSAADQRALKADVEAGTASGTLQQDAPKDEVSQPAATREGTNLDTKVSAKKSDKDSSKYNGLFNFRGDA
jgi:hypothetical protein